MEIKIQRIKNAQLGKSKTGFNYQLKQIRKKYNKEQGH